jgi:uncharacterized repeat protein (TIGR01451 family)
MRTKKSKVFAVVLCVTLLFTQLLSLNAFAAGQADLVFTSAAITSVTSDKITYTYTIRNNGDVTIPDLYNVSIQNFYSSNTIFNDAGDKAAGGSILGVRRSLAPGESYTGTFYSLVSVPAGMNYLTFKIDWGGIVAELNENNNTKYLSLLPDLEITNMTITSKSGDRINYTYTIKNTGGNTIPNLYYVSIQNLYCASPIFDSTNGTAAGGRIIGVNMPLGPGETYTGTWYASGAVPAGKPYLITKIDWGNIVTEYNESNNTYANYVG